MLRLLNLLDQLLLPLLVGVATAVIVIIICATTAGWKDGLNVLGSFSRENLLGMR